MFLASLLSEGNTTCATEPSQPCCRKDFDPNDSSLTGGVAANPKEDDIPPSPMQTSSMRKEKAAARAPGTANF